MDETIQKVNQEILDISRKILDACEGENGVSTYLAIEGVRRSILEHFLSMHKDNHELQMFGSLILNNYKQVDTADTEELLSLGIDPRPPGSRNPDKKTPPQTTRIDVE